jgi:hypothetical protein
MENNLLFVHPGTQLHGTRRLRQTTQSLVTTTDHQYELPNTHYRPPPTLPSITSSNCHRCNCDIMLPTHQAQQEWPSLALKSVLNDYASMWHNINGDVRNIAPNRDAAARTCTLSLRPPPCLNTRPTLTAFTNNPPTTPRPARQYLPGASQNRPECRRRFRRLERETLSKTTTMVTTPLTTTSRRRRRPKRRA